jgi:type I restriction enzyme, S subunit
VKGWIDTGSSRYPLRTLRQCGTRLTTGPFGTMLAASEYVDGGVPLINPTHLRAGRFIPDPQVSVDEITTERLRKHRLRRSDLIIGRHGDMGRSAWDISVSPRLVGSRRSPD